MAIKKILQFPDPRLKQKSAEIKLQASGGFDQETTQAVADVADTLNAIENAAGLAAPQINIHKRIVALYDPRNIGSKEDKANMLVFVNPVLSEMSEETSEETEGCLSVDGKGYLSADGEVFRASVTRPIRVRVDALDAKGNPFHINCDEFLARCIQHEVDHLNGILFIDYLSRLKRDKLKKAILRQQKLQSEQAQ